MAPSSELCSHYLVELLQMVGFPMSEVTLLQKGFWSSSPPACVEVLASVIVREALRRGKRQVMVHRTFFGIHPCVVHHRCSVVPIFLRSTYSLQPSEGVFLVEEYGNHSGLSVQQVVEVGPQDPLLSEPFQVGEVVHLFV